MPDFVTVDLDDFFPSLPLAVYVNPAGPLTSHGFILLICKMRMRVTVIQFYCVCGRRRGNIQNCQKQDTSKWNSKALLVKAQG